MIDADLCVIGSGAGGAVIAAPCRPRRPQRGPARGGPARPRRRLRRPREPDVRAALQGERAAGDGRPRHDRAPGPRARRHDADQQLHLLPARRPRHRARRHARALGAARRGDRPRGGWRPPTTPSRRRSASRASTRRSTTATAASCSTAGARCATRGLGDPAAPADLVPQELQRLRRRRAVQLGLPARPQALRAGDLRDRRRRRRRARDARLPRRADRDRGPARDRRARAPRRAHPARAGRRGRGRVRRDRLERAADEERRAPQRRHAAVVQRRHGDARADARARARLRRRPDDGLRRRGRLPAGELVPAAGVARHLGPGLVRHALRPDARLHALRELRRRRRDRPQRPRQAHGAPARAARPDQVPHDGRRPRRAQARHDDRGAGLPRRGRRPRAARRRSPTRRSPPREFGAGRRGARSAPTWTARSARPPTSR